MRGLPEGADGRALAPWHRVKKGGRRYHYYLSTRETHEGTGASELPRLPAAELEALVVEQLRRVFRAPEMVAEVVSQSIARDPTLDVARVTFAMTQVDQVWDQLFPIEQQRLIQLVLKKAIVTPTNLEMRLHSLGIGALANEFRMVDFGAVA